MRRVILAGMGLLALACSALSLLATPPTATPDAGLVAAVLPTVVPTAEPPPTPTVFPTAIPDDPDWSDPAGGVERRDITVVEPRTGASVRWHMVRLDPSRIRFTVLYATGIPNTITGWQAETGALVVVNGGFFDAVLTNQGLTLVNGEVYGTRRDYSDEVGVGGLFAVKGDEVSIVPLERDPVPPGAYDYDYATEAYPMLLLPGGEPAFPTETGSTAKRTVVAMDTQGRVIFIIIRDDIFTLRGLSTTLAKLGETHNIPLDVALNLDGGTSSAMAIRAGTEDTHWFAETSLPIVIAAYHKEDGG